MAALLLAVFTVSVGYGVVLPLLPYLIERLLGAGVEAAQISRHTGLLTGVYALALFLFAPAWGRLSDRLGRRGVLLVGLLGFGVTMMVFSFIESLTAVYAERFLSGMFASAVTPVAAATIGDFTTEEGRGHRLAFVSMAGIIGFLLGPMLGVFVTRFAANFFSAAMPAGSVAIPLAATALLAFLITPMVAIAVPRRRIHDQSKKAVRGSADRDAWLMQKLLMLTFIVAAGVGVFEVGLALRGKQELGLTPYQIALMFTECSLNHVSDASNRIFARGQAGYDPLVHRARTGRAGGRAAPRAVGVGFHLDAGRDQCRLCQCWHSLAGPDLLDFDQGWARTGMGTRQTNGSGQSWGHCGLGGRRTSLQYRHLAWRLLSPDRRACCAGRAAKHSTAAFTCAKRSWEPRLATNQRMSNPTRATLDGYRRRRHPEQI